MGEEILKHIKLGTKEVLYFNYVGRFPLPLRPLSSWELDDCFYKALKEAPSKIASFLVDLKLDLLKDDVKINLSNEGYAELRKYYDSIDYWIVYHAMKDFQDEWFRQPDFETDIPKGFEKIKEMQEIHKIAAFVYDTSYQPREVIEKIFKDKYGREVAYCVFYLKVPLADIPDLTKLQRDYLLYSKGKLPQIMEGAAKEKSYSISGEEMTFQELMEKLGL